MKKLVLLVVLGLASAMALPAKAQVSLSINIGAQPDWGPRGYNHVDYYYMPDIESYYYVPTRKFIYYSGNRWVHSRSLPSRYRGYNLHAGRKYVINSHRPYMNHHVYKVKYKKHYNNRPSIRHYSEGRRGNDRHYKAKERHDHRRHDKKRDRRDPGIERIIRPRG